MLSRWVLMAYVAFPRPSNLALRTFGAQTVATYEEDGERYVVLGFREAYMSTEECVHLYTNENGPATECAVASAELCARNCSASSKASLGVSHRRTKTAVYKLGNSIEEAFGSSPPRLIKIQEIPSLGVEHVHSMEFVQPATQERYVMGCRPHCKALRV